ncbi:DUF6292 family protein [Actinoplanes xinjiangensis]|uniref:DUF6292 domain-containing protein n=1 Tax=Actinoplanes xinjiangensis TaxID=512350 RepID=A0A316FU14_9ACTN|nr:DUF6292 family protein [Actinoplanes xinjiangensis]PWK52234.1 hypothetical protein BC793_101243 [Actinoplanes xinjiangensis]GIF37061.1 hypothetical protein Axi01nite_13720 [Actinoplanes xinjiangensis]
MTPDGDAAVDGTRSAHSGYLRAVAAALEAAGVPVADWRADSGSPRDGWIPFDLARQVRLHGRPVWDHDEAGAGWSEERGWYLLTVDDPAGRGVRTVEALAVPMIAAPGAVARAIASLAGLCAPGGPRAEAGADFPGHRAGVPDPAFEAALLRYSASRTKSVDGPPGAAEGRG